MAKWTMRGLDEYAAFLQRLEKNTPEIIGAGVYAMAGVVADKVRENIENLQAYPQGQTTYKIGKKVMSRLSEEQKKGLLDGFGISPMQDDDGFHNVKLGFDGYNSAKSKNYTNGQPNALIARVTESGSSYREKTPFIRPAINSVKKEALQKAKVIIDETISEIKP